MLKTKGNLDAAKRMERPKIGNERDLRRERGFRKKMITKGAREICLAAELCVSKRTAHRIY